MATSLPALQIFLSSPGDVGAQREVARETVERLNQDPLVNRSLILQVIGWDSPGARVPLNANQTPQLSVNEYLLTPSDCDLMIVILWSRLGTPIPEGIREIGNQSTKSGTLWEFENALQAGKPVWLYRKTTAPLVELTDIDLEDKIRKLREVDDFLATSKNSDGSIRFGVNGFANDEELRALLGEHLRHFVRGYVDRCSNFSQSDSAGDSVSNYAQSDVVYQVVEAATLSRAELETPGEPGNNALLSLDRYPIGPMIKDIVVRHLAEAIAEVHHSADPRTIFAEINEALKRAAGQNDPQLRISVVSFATTMGSKHFWEDVLHHAAVQGPRMLSAVLCTVPPEMLEADAANEFHKLIRRVNSYA